MIAPSIEVRVTWTSTICNLFWFVTLLSWLFYMLYHVLSCHTTKYRIHACKTTTSTQKERTGVNYFGSGGPSERGFMDSLHKLRNTRNASFCRMWANAPTASCVSVPSSSDAPWGVPNITNWWKGSLVYKNYINNWSTCTKMPNLHKNAKLVNNCQPAYNYWQRLPNKLHKIVMIYNRQVFNVWSKLTDS